MGRWKPGARSRLEQAALELFIERGFDQVTVSEISERAGLKERSFFRYFADKREALFSGQEQLQTYLVEQISAAPDAQHPLGVIAQSLQDVANAVFEPRRSHSQRRQAVIDSVEGLRERELLKLTAFSGAIAEGLRKRGMAEPAASLTAESGITIFKIAFGRWLELDNEQPLSELIRLTLDTLGTVTVRR